MVISVPDMNDSFSRIVLDGKEILLRFTYCVSGGYWLFGVYTLDEKPIVASMKIVPDSPLNIWYRDDRMPMGTFGAVSDNEIIGRNSFLNGEAEFVFLSHKDLGVEL